MGMAIRLYGYYAVVCVCGFENEAKAKWQKIIKHIITSTIKTTYNFY